MLIEHTFITTLEATEALGQASAFLREMGFTVVPQAAFPMGATGLSELELTRGKPNKAYPDQCLQQVRLEFDRGRVNVALSILPRRQSAFMLSRRTASDLKANSKRGRPYAELMIALAQAIDDLLTQRKELNEVQATYLSTQAVLSTAIRRRHRRRTYIVLGIFFLLFAFWGVIVYIALNSRSTVTHPVYPTHRVIPPATRRS